jgi:hypothetical protein
LGNRFGPGSSNKSLNPESKSVSITNVQRRFYRVKQLP